MKKQKIRPTHALRFFWLTLLLIVIVFGVLAVVFVFIESRYDALSLIGSVCGLIASTICLAIFIMDIKKGIEFKDKSIYVPADTKFVVKRIQHETTIQYDEIEDIGFAAVACDSLGQEVEGVFFPHPYLIFACKDGKEKSLNLLYYTKKQTIKIIDETKRRAAAIGNELNIESGEVLLKEFLQKVKNSKKRKKTK